MAETTTPFRGRTTDRIANEIDHWIDDLELGSLWQKVEDFGRKNPVALALAAVTIGLAAGVLARRASDSGASDRE